MHLSCGICFIRCLLIINPLRAYILAAHRVYILTLDYICRTSTILLAKEIHWSYNTKVEGDEDGNYDDDGGDDDGNYDDDGGDYYVLLGKHEHRINFVSFTIF